MPSTSASTPTWFQENDIHLHVPAGAVPKDGPSAGITMATAIASLVRNQPVSEDVGMTGEITLTGQVLPIGGIREKSLAAQRAGLKRIIVPRDNEPDLAELPPETKKELEFVLVDTIDEVFEAAFDGKGTGRPERASGQPEGREQPVAGARVAAAFVAAEQQVLRLSAQDEGKALDKLLAVTGVRDLVAPRPQPRDRDGGPVCHGSVLLLRQRVGRVVELGQNPAPQGGPKRPHEREPRHRHELSAPRGLHLGPLSGDRPAAGCSKEVA